MADAHESLIARCVAGENTAWDAFVAQYAGLILGTARATVRRFGLPHDDADLEDAAADTMLALFKDDCRLLRRYDPAQPLERWLAVIARARCIDYFRRKKPGRLAPMPEAEPAAPPSEEHRRETAEAVQEALGRLPQRDALLLRLVYFQHMSHADAGRLLDLTANAVGVAVHRAKAKLEQELTSMGLEWP